MATPIEMPKPGVTVEQCLLLKWHKAEGDRVTAGELIAEIETDKAVFEIVAPAGGMLLARFFPESELVPVYANLCVLGEPGEDVEPFRPKTAPLADAGPVPDVPSRGHREAAGEPLVATGETVLSPRARRFARERQFPPTGMAGSGPGGRILEADLRAAYYSRPRVSSLAQMQVAEGCEVRGEGSGIGGMILAKDLAAPPAALSSVRDRIARRMRESLGSTAQYTLTSSAAAGGLLALRGSLKSRHPEIGIGEMVLFCAVRALLRMPELNAELIDGKLYRHAHVHLGFACDTPRGLLVPVVRYAENLPLADLALQVRTLAGEAVGGTIPPDDLAGATFTVSNLGSLGVESFTPILNPPQVALLGVNSIRLTPVRRNGQIEFEDRIGLSLTADHQVIDGAPGARFLLVLRECIEQVEGLVAP